MRVSLAFGFFVASPFLAPAEPVSPPCAGEPDARSRDGGKIWNPTFDYVYLRTGA